MNTAPRFKLASGFVVWNDTHQVFYAKEDGSFVWDKMEEAQAACRKDEGDRPRQVEILLLD